MIPTRHLSGCPVRGVLVPRVSLCLHSDYILRRTAFTQAALAGAGAGYNNNSTQMYVCLLNASSGRAQGWQGTGLRAHGAGLRARVQLTAATHAPTQRYNNSALAGPGTSL